MKSDMMDEALERLAGDMDAMEGRDAMKHPMEECPDPMTCTQHDDELGEGIAEDKPVGVAIEVKPIPGMPSMEGEKSEGEGSAEEGLSPEDVEELRKLVK